MQSSSGRMLVLRTQLRMYWTLGIYLEVAEEERLNRAASGDAKRLGGAEGVLARYRKRYLPAFDLYLERDDPIAHADVIVDNNDVDHPVVLRWPRLVVLPTSGSAPSGTRQAPTHRVDHRRPSGKGRPVGTGQPVDGVLDGTEPLRVGERPRG